MKRFLALILLAAAALAPAAWTPSAAQSQAKAERRDPIFLRFPEMAERYWVNTETIAASHKVVADTDAAPVRLPLCRLLYQGADERERGAADGALELQPQARRAGTARRELQHRLPLPGRDQQRALRRAAQRAARRFLRAGVDLLSRRPRQRRPRERRRPVRRPDRPRPLGHLFGRQPARRAGLRGHLHQQRPGQRPVLAVLLRRQVQRQRQLPEQDRRAQRPHHRARPDRRAACRW